MYKRQVLHGAWAAAAAAAAMTTAAAAAATATTSPTAAAVVLGAPGRIDALLWRGEGFRGASSTGFHHHVGGLQRRLD